MTSGWMPMPRSSLTECWVGLVLSSPVAARAGSSVTWTHSTVARPTSVRLRPVASRYAPRAASRARPAALDDHDGRIAVARGARDAFLDLVGDVRDDLDRTAEVI